jgi:hypothetical protein
LRAEAGLSARGGPAVQRGFTDAGPRAAPRRS